jgi:hypothetical protein
MRGRDAYASYERSDAEGLFDLFCHLGRGYQVLEADYPAAAFIHYTNHPDI